MTTTDVGQQSDFAAVYAQNLDAVWRFVRSRVGDAHEAQDVTADIFVRAWRSWDRYDRNRGPVEPWLFTIARREVIDRSRRPRREEPTGAVPVALGAADEADRPDQQALKAELLNQLGQALDGLQDREREALAMRFAARLSMATVAEVLGTTTAAAKMVVHRAIRRLEGSIGEATAATTATPADLERVIDRVVDRGHPWIGSTELERLLVHVAAVHDVGPTPLELGGHVARCVRCEAERDETDDDPAPDSAAVRPRGTRATGFARVGALLASILSFAGVCLACTVPALHAVLVAIGIVAAGYALHLVGVAAAPVVVWLVWRGTRRHGLQRARHLTVTGGALMAIHAVLHVGLQAVGEQVLAPPPIAALFVATDWAGTALLVAGALVNLWGMRRWRRTQADQLRRAWV